MPIKLMILNWLVKTYDLNFGKLFTLAEFRNATFDVIIGVVLIVIALLHNIIYKYIQFQSNHKIAIGKSDKNELDKHLMDGFVNVFGSNSNSAILIRDHDFGGPFIYSNLDGVREFVREWNCPERSFHNVEVEGLKIELWDRSKAFLSTLAGSSTPIGGDMQGVVPQRLKGDVYPEWLNNEIRQLNQLASELHGLHKSFMQALHEKIFLT